MTTSNGAPFFINTRPQSRAAPLTTALQKRGISVFNLPLLVLKTIPLETAETKFQTQFTQKNASIYQALVVVSPTAARLGLESCPHGFIPACPIIAVGSATAHALEQAGWQVNCPVESSNEGMMRMKVITNLQSGNKVLIWRGRGGRRLLVNHLKDKGIGVDAIEWYERLLPDDAPENFAQMQSVLLQRLSSTPNSSTKLSDSTPSPYPIVLVSSGEAFNYWQQLLSKFMQQSDADYFDSSLLNTNSSNNLSSNNLPYRQLSDFVYLTFGKRLTDRLSGLQLTCHRLDNLSEQSVLHGIDTFISLINT